MVVEGPEILGGNTHTTGQMTGRQKYRRGQAVFVVEKTERQVGLPGLEIRRVFGVEGRSGFLEQEIRQVFRDGPGSKSGVRSVCQGTGVKSMFTDDLTEEN